MAHRPIPAWGAPPDPPAPGDDDVHVWRAGLDVTPERARALGATLSPDERARADRFRFEWDRGRSIAARGALRAILARYLDADPRALIFQYNPHGKPALAGVYGDALRFNLSHAGGLALYAVARGREVGIDVERIADDVEIDALAARFFAPEETRGLAALPPEARRGAFFRCWTRKEAYVKARGLGLALPLDLFAVSVAPGEPARLSWAPEGDPARWSLRDLDPDPGYAAALAVEGDPARVLLWQW